MELKRLKMLDIFIIFGLCFIFHFLYSIWPNSLFSIFFPVNESIWEHMKMLFSSIVFGYFIELFLIKKFNVKCNNALLSAFITGILSIVIFLAIYLPIYFIIGENIIINITVLFIVIYITQIIGYYIMKQEEVKYSFRIALIGIIVSYIIFGYLTYFPPKNILFLDPSENKYGINFYDF